MSELAVLDRDDVSARVLQAVAAFAEKPPSEITWHTNLYTDLALDSLSTVSLFLHLRLAFGVLEPTKNEDYEQIDTPSKLLDYIMARAT